MRFSAVFEISTGIHFGNTKWTVSGGGHLCCVLLSAFFFVARTKDCACAFFDPIGHKILIAIPACGLNSSFRICCAKNRAEVDVVASCCLEGYCCWNSKSNNQSIIIIE